MAIDVSVAIFQIGGLLLLWYFNRLTVPYAYGVMGAACALACCGWFFGSRQPLRFAWPAAIGDWWHNWGFARWALASHLIGYAVPYGMPWIVTAARGSGEAGALAACITVVGVASMFITGLASFLMPRAAMAFSHGGVAPLRKVLRNAAAVYAGVVGVFAVFIFCTGDFLLVLAFGAKFAGYGNVLAILHVEPDRLALGLTAGIGLCAIDRPSANLLADICTLVVTLTIMVCLMQPLGVLGGAALGDLGGKVIGTIVRYATLRRLLKHFLAPLGGVTGHGFRRIPARTREKAAIPYRHGVVDHAGAVRLFLSDRAQQYASLAARCIFRFGRRTLRQGCRGRYWAADGNSRAGCVWRIPAAAARCNRMQFKSHLSWLMIAYIG